jgi:hypothetical protein
MAFPVILVAEVALKAIDHLLDKRKATASAPAVKKAIESAVKNDPVLINELNAEPVYASRVVQGTVIAMFGTSLVAVSDLYLMLKTGNFDVARASVEIATLMGNGWALYGRLRSGLKPLFSGG